MSIEAMKQALEALEYHQEQTRPIHKTQETIATLRQTIEQAEKQKPIGWFAKSWQGVYVELMPEAADAIPLYTAPPKRENELDIAERSYFAGKKDGIDETIALIRSKNT
jgi:hypothetical protein